VAQSQAVYGSLSSPDMCLHTASDTAAHTAGDADNSTAAGTTPGSLVSSLKLNTEAVQQQQQRAMSVYDTAGRDAAVDGSGEPAGAAGPRAAARNNIGSATDGAGATAKPAASSPRVGSVAAAVRVRCLVLCLQSAFVLSFLVVCLLVCFALHNVLARVVLPGAAALLHPALVMATLLE
jgi:hypothetical protein